MFFECADSRTLAIMATIFALIISEGLAEEDIELLSAFFASIGDSLALIAIKTSGA